MQNLPTDLLRTFVAIIEAGGFSHAGERLGRSQPAISLQIKRLEEVAGVTLFNRSGRSFELSEAGHLLLSYARSILNLNDEVLARLLRSSVSGIVRLGVPNEFADSFLPSILGQFAARYPDIALEVGCELSTLLLSKLERNEYDLIFSLHSQAQRKSDGWQENLVWVAGPQLDIEYRTPLPLIVAPQGCVYRQRIVQTLEERGIPWSITYTSPSFGGIKAGVQAGLGVTVLAQSTVPESLRILKPHPGLPKLGSINVHLHYNQHQASEAVLALVEYMSHQLDARPPGLF